MTEKEIRKVCVKNNKTLWRTLLVIFLLVVGIGGILYSCIMQMILCYQKFGVVISSKHLFIPHLSLLGHLGWIPICCCYFIID